VKDYKGRVDHDWKIRTGGRGGISGNIPFLSRTIQLWNKLPMNDLKKFPLNEHL
jgi:hypothetical protein